MTEDKEFTIGDRVRVISLPPYIKTAEPMPMLRPPSVIQLGEEGIVVDRRPGGYWSVRFNKGIFLIDSQYLETIAAVTEVPSAEHAVDSGNLPIISNED